MVDGQTFIQLRPNVGYLSNDADPYISNLSNFWIEEPIPLDVPNMSVGLDLGSVSRVHRLELWDSDDSSRVTESDYKLYISNENVKKWRGEKLYTDVSGWRFS